MDAPTRKFTYKFGKTYSLPLWGWFAGWKGVVNKGFHSYHALDEARWGESEWGSHCTLMQGVIPKGSKYFMGYSGQIVSSRIKIVKPYDS